MFRSFLWTVSARTRLAISLVGVMVSVLLVAKPLGLIPDRDQAVMHGRQQLCEATAMSGSALLVANHSTEGFEAVLRGFVQRNPDVQSVGLRRQDGRLVMEIGPHDAHWQLPENGESSDRCMYVPLFDGDQQWGRLEWRFTPLAGDGWLAYLSSDLTGMLCYCSVACFVLFRFFLRRMLKQLDPSGAVPKRVREALDNLAEGLVIVDLKDNVLLANNAFATVVGIPPERLVGRRISRMPWVVDAGRDARDHFPWKRAIQQGCPISNAILQMDDVQGTRRTFSVNSSPLLGHEGKYRGVMVTLDDVTSLEEHRVELRNARDAAVKANESKSEFLANMSHEIRTPMNAIMGFTDVLRRGMEESKEKRVEYLNTIHSSSRHLLDIINDILDLSKIEAGKLELEIIACSPCHIMSEVINVLQVRAQEQTTTLTWSVEGAIPETIQGDPTRLRQVLMNVVGNAIKFTSEGRVSLTCRMDPSGEGRFLKFMVADTGIGMTDEQMARIFQPFQQADSTTTRRFGGTGLGLAISKRFAEALGGRIEVTSQWGKGSVFTIVIATGDLTGVPMIDDKTARDMTRAEASSQLHTVLPRIRPSRILVVDDGVTNRQLISLVLGKMGLDVVEAENGQEAVEIAGSQNVDLILMDMQMPVMDGYTATRTLRDRGVGIPIVALTANAMQQDADKCLAAGCDRFLPKPIDLDALTQLLVEALGRDERGSDQAIETLTPARDLPECRSSVGPSRTTRSVIQSSLPVDDPVFRDIVARFIEILPGKLEAMCSAWDEADYDKLADLAHWLKGAGGTVGFGDFTEPARHLERAVQQHAADEIGPAIEKLIELAGRIALDSPINPADLATCELV